MDSKASADQPNASKLIRSQFKDVTVKVEDDVYYLDRLPLALKSGFFEKLFAEGKSGLIEISQMNSKTFSAAVDIMYGKSLGSVMDASAHADNFVSLLMAMDYLQMDIDTEICQYFVTRETTTYIRPLSKDIFKFYDLITNNAKYEYWLPLVYKNLSKHLVELKDRDELLSIKPDHFPRVIARQDSLYSFKGLDETFYPFRTISKICARWICHDLENRSQHALKLLNAARYRFSLSNKIAEEEFKLPLSSNNKHVDQNSISRYFCKWLMYFGEIRRSKPVVMETSKEKYRDLEEEHYEYESMRGTYNSPYVFNSEPKLKMFLQNNDYYDITAKVGEKMYKLHRPVLKSESSYFNELFSNEYSELAAKCDGIPTLPSKDKVYTIDDIDSTIFDLVVDHMYLGKVEPTQEIALPLLKAAHLLKIDSLKESCSSWMKKNYDQMNTPAVVEILNFTHENTEYTDLNRFLVSKYIVDSWPKIAKLRQFADLFNAIVLPEGDDSCENGVYLFDKVDQETFKTIIDYLYFKKKELRENNLARVLRASDMFKIKKLTEECVERLLWWPKKMSPADIREVLNVTQKNLEYYEVLNTVYLAEYMKQWPVVDIDLLGTISDDCLEDMLISHNLHFDDPRVLLDICSKWVMHDVENRYRLIPRIALAISRNRTANCDDYSITNPPNWKECSQDFVKEKIREVLSSTSILPSQSLSEDEIKKRKIELPVFITSKKGRSFSVLNADWDEIVSFRLGENVCDVTGGMFYITRYPMSATIMNDNLFILCCMQKSSFFYVYNFSSEKIFSLASDPRIYKEKDIEEWHTRLEYTLLNCCNDIYCCHEDGQILKYSPEFNRWMRISDAEPKKYGIRYASDGDKLFRMLEMSRTDSDTNYTIDVYDFEQNLWISTPLPSLTRHHKSYANSDKDRKLRELVFLNNHGLAALFRRRLLIFNQETRLWQKINSLPSEYEDVVEEHEIINKNQADEMLYVYVNKLYKFSPANKSWELRKEWPMESGKSLLSHRKQLPYGNIIGIHNPKPSKLFHLRSFTSLAPNSRPLITRAVRLGGQLKGSHFQSAPARALVSLGLLARSFF